MPSAKFVCFSLKAAGRERQQSAKSGRPTKGLPLVIAARQIRLRRQGFTSEELVSRTVRAFTSVVEADAYVKQWVNSRQPCDARLCRLGAPFRLILEASLELIRWVLVRQWNDADSTAVRGVSAVAKIIKLPSGNGLMYQGLHVPAGYSQINNIVGAWPGRTCRGEE